MRRILAFILAIGLWVAVAPAASADVAGLQPCSDVPAYSQRFNNQINRYQAQLQKYDANSEVAGNIQAKIARTQARSQEYSGFLCGPEGWPRLIVDGRPNHAGEFIFPGLLFLYLAGWLGWSGRNYLQAKAKQGTDLERREIQIDLPLAIQSFAASLLWPLQAIKETLSGEIQEKDTNITVSPR